MTSRAEGCGRTVGNRTGRLLIGIAVDHYLGVAANGTHFAAIIDVLEFIQMDGLHRSALIRDDRDSLQIYPKHCESGNDGRHIYA